MDFWRSVSCLWPTGSSKLALCLSLRQRSEGFLAFCYETLWVHPEHLRCRPGEIFHGPWVPLMGNGDCEQSSGEKGVHHRVASVPELKYVFSFTKIPQLCWFCSVGHHPHTPGGHWVAGLIPQERVCRRRPVCFSWMFLSLSLWNNIYYWRKIPL